MKTTKTTFKAFFTDSSTEHTILAKNAREALKIARGAWYSVHGLPIELYRNGKLVWTI